MRTLKNRIASRVEKKGMPANIFLTMGLEEWCVFEVLSLAIKVIIA